MKRVFISSLLIISTLMFGCNARSSQTDSSSELSSDTELIIDSQTEIPSQTIPSSTVTSESIENDDTVYYSGDTYRLKYYDSIEELFDVSEVVITGDCISSKPVYQLGHIYTVSEVKVSNCYKGMVDSGDIIQVVEMGGRDNYGEWSKNCNSEVKDFPTETHPEDSKVVVGTDGFYPMKEGDSVLLFLGDTTGFLQEIDGILYDVMGTTDGILYLQSDGSYVKPTPSQTDLLVFDEGNLSADDDMLKKLMK